MKLFFMRFTVFFTALLLTMLCLFNGSDKAGSAYEAADADAVRLNVAVVSDLHAASELKHDRSVVLARLFAGVAKSETPLDALVLPGDLTNNGTRDEYRCLSAILLHNKKADNVIAALGNHDARGDMDKEDLAENMGNYKAFCALMGVETDHSYWAKTVKGYSFIVLGSETEEKDRAGISDEQIEWLDARLADAAESGKPAFIVCHQVIDHTNNVDHEWWYDGSIGEKSDAVRDVIRKYTDNGLTVLFISGHLHQPFCAHTFEQPWENLYCLNLPSAQYTEESGQGCTLEAYDDQVLIRTRNFITGEWLPDEFTIPLS